MRPPPTLLCFVALTLGACASASNVAPRTSSTGAPAPHCLPQGPARDLYGVVHNTASSGWVVVQTHPADRSAVELVDPSTGHVLAIERLGTPGQLDLIKASPDPMLRFLCVQLQSFGPTNQPTRSNTIGVWDLGTHAWRWRQTTTEAGSVVAGDDHCLFDRGPALEARAFTDGAVLGTSQGSVSGTARMIVRGGTPDEPWILTRELASGHSAGDQHVLYDGRTARVITVFQARCAVLEADRVGVVWPEDPGDAAAQKARAHAETRLGPRLHTVPGSTCAEIPDWTALPPDPILERMPSPALLIDDDRVLAHVDGGLFIWRWASEAPILVRAGPPAQPRDANGRRHPLTPALAPDGTWVGVLGDDATLARIPLPGAPGPSGPLAPLPLPSSPLGDTADTALWQASVGPPDADGYPLAVMRDTSAFARTLYLGHTARPGQWKAVRKARLYAGLWPELFWPSGAPGTLLIGETHFGPQVVSLDGKHVTKFPMTITSSRVEPFLVSGDRLFMGVDPVFGQPDGGLYVLALPGLERLEHQTWLRKPEDLGEHWSFGAQWLADGRVVVIGPRVGRGVGHADWATVTAPPRAPGRKLVQHLRGDAWDLYDGAGRRIATLGLRDGGGWVEWPDGRVTCNGGGCSRYRTTLPDWTSAPVTSAGCQVRAR